LKECTDLANTTSDGSEFHESVMQLQKKNVYCYHVNSMA